jgi:malate synthase
MPRILVTLSQNVFNQLQVSATQKQIPTARYARDLINVGLQVEEAIAKEENSDNSKKSDIEELGDLKILWKNNLSWLLESLHLIRYLTHHLAYSENLSPEENKNRTDEIIQKAKEKAQSYVEGLLEEKI